MAEHLNLPPPRPVGSRRARGGGGERPSRNPRRHGGRLTQQVEGALEARRRPAVEGVDPRLVFKIQSRTRLTDEELQRRGLAVLADTSDWRYVVLPDDEEASSLRRDLHNYSGGPDVEGEQGPLSSFFDLVEAIEPYGPDDRRGPGIPEDPSTVPGKLLVDLTLWPSPVPEEATRRIEDVRRVAGAFGDEVVAFDPRPQSTVVRIRASPEAIQEVLELVVVERVRTPLTPLVDPSDWIRAEAEEFTPGGESAEAVGVLDDGVSSGHQLLDSVVEAERAFPEEHEWRPHGSHGTMVAGLAVYGEFGPVFQDPNRRLPPAAPIAIGRVLEPDPDAYDDWTTRFPPRATPHQTLEEAIRGLHADYGVRVFCIAIGEPQPFEGPHVEVLTERLDNLARELRIVIVVPSGNAPASLMGDMPDGSHALHDYPEYMLKPEQRLAEPGPAALAITVGSIAESDAPATPGAPDATTSVRTHAVAGKHELSPFSRVGPGVSNAVKPDLVHYGGNWVWTEHGSISSWDTGASTISLNSSPATTGRLFSCGSGTSFAVPRVARLAAEVWSAYPDASSELVRALLVLSASWPPEAEEQFLASDPLPAIGYGLPHGQAAVSCGQNRVVMVHDGSMECDTTVIHPIPVPYDFAWGASRRTFSVALAFNPPVRRQRREYLGATMRVDLLRALDMEEITEIYAQQPREREKRLSLPRNRQRVQNLLPGSDRLIGSTLQLRRWTANNARSLNVDDGDTYYLAVTHALSPWAANLVEDYTSQSYALAVELHDIGRAELDLYNQVQQQVRQPARVRARP